MLGARSLCSPKEFLIFARPLIRMTIGQIFLHQAKAFESRRFIYRPDQSAVTYGEASMLIVSWVQQMKNLGIKKGDHIICYEEMPDPMIYFFLAAQFIGAISVPVSPLFSTSYVNELAKRLGSRYVFCSPSVYAGCDSERLPLEMSINYEITTNLHAAFQYLETVHEDINCDDVIMLQSTAGSTGAPKIVIRKHSALTHYAKYLSPELKNLDVLKPHRYLMLLSFAHSFAYHQLATALSLGAELAVPIGLDTDVELREIYQLVPTVLSLPPRVLRSFTIQEKNIESQQYRSHLFPKESQYVVVGGGQGDASIMLRLQNERITPIQIYSSSETSMVAITKNGEWYADSTGTLVPSVNFKLAGDGEILIQSPGLMLGYKDDPEATASAFDSEGYFKTGDIGALSVAGTLRILGRKKDVFNTVEGSNIFPSRIEDMVEITASGSHVILVGDSRPYLSALIFLPPEWNWISEHELGYLDPLKYNEIYAEMGELLQSINNRLEQPEMVARFHLYMKDFPEDCYGKVQGSKIRRNRMRAAKIFSTEISNLYRSPMLTDITCVPGVNRRLRKAG